MSKNHSAVPRKRMKELMRRSDYPAIRDTIIWLGLMGLFAGLGIAFWGSWRAGTRPGGSRRGDRLRAGQRAAQGVPRRTTSPHPSTTGARCRWPSRPRRYGFVDRGVMASWIAACGVDDVDPEDVIPFAHDGQDYAIYRSPGDEYYATDGHCTHEKTLLCDGLVMGRVIECPKHNGRFDYVSGKALGAPVLADIRTYPVKVADGTVFIEVG